MRLILALVLMASGFSASAAEKGVITFRITSSSIYSVWLAFYSHSRDYTWPDSNEYLQISDSVEHNYKVRCEIGETVCFGAFWDTLGKQWGVGKDDKLKCKGCCLVCDREEANVFHRWELTDQ